MSTARMGSLPMPSVQSVIAGLHDDGEVVTVVGVLNGLDLKRTKQGNDWATFRLFGEHTAVDVSVFPLPFQHFRDLIGPVHGPDETLLPPTVTVTARVYGHPVPSLIATDLRCQGHEDHGPHRSRRLPAAARADMDLSAITRIVGRAVREIRTSGEQLPESASTALAEVAEVLHRYGYCDDPMFPLPEADEGVSLDEAIATLRNEGGDAR